MMRKRETRWWIYVCVLLLFALLAWACGKPVESVPETGTGTETAEVKPTAESKSETEEPESGTEKSESGTKESESRADDAESQTPEAPDRETESTVSSGAETPALETEKETAEKVTEPIPEETEALSTYVYHIDELDVDLEIPENLYVYRTAGIYLEDRVVCGDRWTGEIKRYDFCSWILVTDREYDGKEELEEKLIEDYQAEAEHIRFIVRIKPRELSPAADRGGTVLSCFGQWRMTETGYYCEVGKGVSCLSQEYYGPGTERYMGYGATEHTKNAAPEEKALTEKWVKAIKEKTITKPFWCLEYMVPYMLDYVEWEDRFRTTIFDDRFWEVYCQAVEELTSFPEKYEYTDERSLSLIDQEIQKRKELIDDMQFEAWEASITDIYADSGEDIYIRAYCYAKYVTGREYRLEMGRDDVPREITLNDVIVLLMDWSKGQRSFETFIEGAGFNGDHHFAGDFDWLCDMTKAREYVVSRRAQEGR